MYCFTSAYLICLYTNGDFWCSIMVVTGESLLCTAIMDEEEESYVGTSSEENLEQDSLEVCRNEVQDSVL